MWVAVSLVLIFVVVCLAIYTVWWLNWGSLDSITFTVKDKWVKYHNNEAKYLISSENEVFEDTDNALRWKWDSSDVYNYMDVGKVCSANVIGIRVPILSWYRNILSAACEYPYNEQPGDVGK